MRKWIIYILIFAVSLMMIISTVLLISIYKNTANIQINKNDELAKTDNNTIVDNNEIVTTSYSNIKISPNASIVFKTLYKECNHHIRSFSFFHREYSRKHFHHKPYTGKHGCHINPRSYPKP